MYFVLTVLVLILKDVYSSGTVKTNSSNNRIYFMKRCGGAGCPYTASWFIHTNLYRKVSWWIDITKMEAASFAIFDKAKWKFQLSDPDAYFVHHMSMYEHFLHKKQGFDVANNQTLILSRAALHGECDKLAVRETSDVIAFIPFYGGLPPNVTKDLSVKSIGQGNSLVDGSVKVLQAMATLCSCLRYYGRAIIGVARNEDRKLVLEMLHGLSPAIRDRTNLVQLQMHKPSHLPFHVLAWGQFYVMHHNCRRYYDMSQPPISPVAKQHLGFSIHPMQRDFPHGVETEICRTGAIAKYHGSPLNLIYSLKDLSVPLTDDPIRFVYYTECDQVVRYDSNETYLALASATNETTFFTGRRKEKAFDTSPQDYMDGLRIWRECGVPGYSLQWPQSNLVMPDNPQ